MSSSIGVPPRGDHPHSFAIGPWKSDFEIAQDKGLSPEMVIQVNTMSTQAAQFQTHVQALVTQIIQWVEPSEWVTKQHSKKLRDHNQQPFEIPALFLQKGPSRLLLDPVAYDVPGTEGVVDLYLMPTYDDVASLDLKGGTWTIHYTFPPDPWETHSTLETQALPLGKDTILKVLDSIANHAEPSF